jgi:hypothetical protein
MEESPQMESLDLSRCAAKVLDYRTAAYIVKTYHYAKRVPSIVFAVGMYVDTILAGVVTYGIPPVPNVQRICGEEYRKNTLELNRLFVFDWAGSNSESWLIGQSFKLLKLMKPQYCVLVSYADSKYGHCGYIYQATNWYYTGISPAMNVGYIIDGHEYHNKALVNMIGSWSKREVLKKFPDAIQVMGGAKYRYVYFLGNKTKNKELKSKLKWDILEYPKVQKNDIKS